ncbi:MAG TPA: YicC/YloC family endoribonuclease [Xanthobacteraceae bacterium]|nr:YicC/YloC family endoribonuclease [Xanthobacteraceae bacterium]
MSLASMTGFARLHGTSGPYAWAWEIKSVNSKGLDLRLRMPPGWDAAEPPVRAAAAKALARGAVSATLDVKREGASSAVRVNEEVLAAVIDTMRVVATKVNAQPPSLDGILGMKGVIEVVEAEENENEKKKAEAAIVAGFDRALADLIVARRGEGEALRAILAGRIDEIARLVAAAEASPARKPEAIRARLAEQIAALLDTGTKFDPDRLHQEALLIAAKVDVREEIDRLVTHIAAARDLLKNGGAVGRRLDFLAQEFNRESNTLCSKANDASLTAIGLELKATVDQFREQVQNLE